MTELGPSGGVVDIDDVCWTRALPLAELLVADHRRPRAAVEASTASHDRLRRWRELTMLHSDERIGDPPELHGCTEAEFLAALSQSPEELRYLTTSASWLLDLARACRCPMPEAPVLPAGFDDGFLAVLSRPIAQAAWRLHDAADLVLRDAAHRPFEPQSLVSLLVPAICTELLHRLAAPGVVELHASRARGELDGNTPEERFTSFVAHLRLPEARLDFLRRYPVLARATTQRLGDWLDTSIEFASRLAADWDVMVEAFPELCTDDCLTSVESVGDLHRRGRSVMIVRFASGAAVVYKPRPVDAEARFQDLLCWLNGRCELPDFRMLTVVARDGYGWVEHVPFAVCRSRHEFERFFVRQGGYLALLHVLGGVDVHSENLIAAGEHPVLVDLETLFHGVPASDLTAAGMASAATLAATSVLRTGLLPQPILGDEDVAGFDPSGLGGGTAQVFPLKLPRWEQSATDEMRLVLVDSELPPTLNRAVDDGLRVAAAHEFAPEILKGFRCVYQTLREHAQTLLDPSGAITAFAEAPMRSVLRPTIQYSLILETSLHPDFLGHALDREQRLDRFLGGTPDWPGRIRIIGAERCDLWRSDIPAFTTRPTSTAIWNSDGGQIDGFFAVSGMELVRDRLTAGDTDHEARTQEWIAATTLATAAVSDGPVSPYPRIPDATKMLSSDDFLAEARSIARRLGELAIRGADDATWMTITATSGTQSTVAPMGADLYGGLAGPAIFLAYLSEVDGDPTHAILARHAVTAMLRQLEIQPGTFGIGAFAGLGGTVYTLAHLALLWGDDELLDQARRFAEQIDESIERDTSFDLLAGSAGAIRALLVLDAVCSSPAAVATAVRCGDHLLRSAMTIGGGIGWLSDSARSTQPLSGLGHGAAGIAVALFELAARTGHQRFAKAAADAITYERSLFSTEFKNWRDVRILDRHRRFAKQIGGQTFMFYWCHGSAGIGLARIQTLRHWDDGQVQDEIRTALAATVARGFGLNHSLCHGDLGNLELIVNAPPAVRAVAPDPAILASQHLANAYEYGWITGHPLGLESPDLMVGITGIGYALLRLAAPRTVPSVLMLDPPPCISLR